MFITNKSIISFILFFVAVLVLFSLSSVSAASFNNGHSSSDIQNFIDTGLSDDDIILEEGDYVDTLYNLNVSRKVNIKSNGKVNIKSSTGGTLFNVTSRDVSILNLNISGFQTAIMSNTSGLSVIGCNISTNNISINISTDIIGSDLTGILLENNTIISSSYNPSSGGVVYVECRGSVVSVTFNGNNITATNQFDCVRFNLVNCDNTLIFNNNNIKTNSYGVNIYAPNNNNNITITINNITGKDWSAVNLYASSYGGTHNNNITITNNNITGKECGVSMGVSASSSAIHNNNIIIYNNNITGTDWYGVSLSATAAYGSKCNNNINITSNNITGTNRAGLILDLSGMKSADAFNDNTIIITNNNITNTGFDLANPYSAFQLTARSSNNSITITNNNITGRAWIGVILAAYNSNNTVLSFIGNNITGNVYAMRINSEEQFSGLSLMNNSFVSNDIGLSFNLSNPLYNATLSDILVTGNTINATNTGIIIFVPVGVNNSVGLTVNYNRILADIGLNFTTIDNGSNFDYNWWSINDITDNVVGFDTNNHYILNITNLTSLDNVRVGDKLGFALLVLNTTLTNECVSNLPYFVINGTFNGVFYSIGSDDLFVHEFTIPSEGLQIIDALLDEQYVFLEFNASKGNTSSTIVVQDDVLTGKTVNIAGIATDDNGNPLDNIQVTVTVDGVSYNVTTDSNGRWILAYKPAHTGNINVSVYWTGNNVYNGFTNSTNFNVEKGNTSSTIVVQDDVRTGKTVNITGIATDNIGNPLANIQITVTVDGVAYNVTTDNNGRWILAYKPTKTGNINVSVFWTGNNVYNGFTNSTNFNVIDGVKNVTFIISSPTINQGEKTNIKVTLKDIDGNILIGKKVSLTINKRTYTATTNNKGIAVFKISGLEGGKHKFSVKFTGDSNYKPLTISKIQKVNSKTDLGIISIKKLSFKKRVSTYRVTIANTGSLKSKATVLALFHMRKGVKIKTKYIKIKSIGAGKKISIIVSYFPDKANHRYCIAHFQVDPKNKNKEIILANNKKSISLKH